MAADSRSPAAQTAGSLADIPEGNVAELFLAAVDRYGKPDALKYKQGGAWHSISHADLYRDVKCAALGMETLGISAGDTVAILSDNRPEWLVADFGCVMARAVSVPLYPVLPGEQLSYMLRDSEARAIFVSTDEQLAKIREIRSEIPSLEHVIVFGDSEDREPGIMSFAELLALGEPLAAERPDDEYRENALATDPHDLLTILYTSGTTGQPKGVMLTHNNLVSNVRSVLAVFDIGERDISLSVLPLCHIFERMAGHYTMFTAAVTICYAESLEKLGDNFVETRPTVMTLVPRGYEKLFARVEEKARQGGPAKEKLLRWAIDVGGRHLDRRLASQKTGPWLSLQYRVADRLVFSKLRKATGGRIRFFVSGGAPLNPALAHFFLSAGLTVVEGYGLTETSPVISFNTADDIRLRTVGRPIAGVEVAIAEDGEILTRGPHVMKGYYKMPEATAAAITPDGWFHTGDVGELVDGQYLKITDRKKDLIVTAGGKNIAPQPIENRVKTNPYVSEVIMVGDRRKFPVLIIAPNFTALESWARSRSISWASREELVREPRVVEFLEGEILGGLGDLARFERPKRIALLPRELTIDMGEITPSLKVKRRVIESKYRDVIEHLYSEE